MNQGLENVLQAMRDALEKLERAIQLPSRKEFDSMTQRVSELGRRLDELERTGPKKKAAKKSSAARRKK